MLGLLDMEALQRCKTIAEKASLLEGEGHGAVQVETTADRAALAALASWLSAVIAAEQMKADENERHNNLDSQQLKYLAAFGEDSGRAQLQHRRGERISGRSFTPEQARCAAVAAVLVTSEMTYLLRPQQMPHLRIGNTGNGTA